MLLLSGARFRALHRGWAVAVAAALAGAGAVVVAPATAAPTLPANCSQETVGGTVTCTFGYTGGAQTFTVPAGVTEVTLTAWGGHGSTGGDDVTPGGRGAKVDATFSVDPGSDLVVTVAQDANWVAHTLGAFGFGRGGLTSEGRTSGGGASAVTSGERVLLVAGGGGGGGWTRSCGAGGAGGDAGHDGQPGLYTGTCAEQTQTSQGAGGVAGAQPTASGGDGLQTLSTATPTAGAGGGGYHGGSSGSQGVDSRAGSGGGGGGSSHADEAGSGVSLSGLSERPAGANGLVTISYLPGPVSDIALSPASGSVPAGKPQSYTVASLSADGASLGDVTAQATFSIGPDGSCAGAVCTPAAAGAHTVTATYGSLTATASLDVTPPQGPVTDIELSPASATVAIGAPQSYSVTGFNADGASLGDVTSATTFTISPDGSCLAAVCTPASAGAHTVTATHVDGVTETASLTVTGPTYAYSGLLAPIDARPVVNKAKAGSSVPVRFSLGADYGLDVLVGGGITSVKVDCASGAPSDEIEQTVASTNKQGLTYDAGSGIYSWIWSTDKKWSGTCRDLTIHLADGSTQTVSFSFK
jgi:hypothetical protein